MSLKTMVLKLSALLITAGLAVPMHSAQAQEESLLVEPLGPVELEGLVGPIALYPDDLLSVVLDASAHPLQIVAASRFLEDVRDNPELKPDSDWDESVVALLNYPEVLSFLNEDLEWTESLGFAFLDQQTELFAAVQNFRKRAYAAGNLKSDDYQQVIVDNFVIKILPAEPDTIYIPAYEPTKVVVYQPYPVFGYYPYAYPVYYYPYAPHYSFATGFFWGVTTYFAINWISGGYHSHYYGYAGHPYYRHTYHYRNHYYYGGQHYAKHGRQHVRHERRHARRYTDYYRGGQTDGRKYARRTDHRRYRDGSGNRPRTVDGSRREQFARSDERVRNSRPGDNRNRNARDARRDDSTANRQVAFRDQRDDQLANSRKRANRSNFGNDSRAKDGSGRQQTDQQDQPRRWKRQSTTPADLTNTLRDGSNNGARQQAGQQAQPRRWKRQDTDAGINNRKTYPATDAQRGRRDTRQSIAQTNRRAMQRTTPDRNWSAVNKRPAVAGSAAPEQRNGTAKTNRNQIKQISPAVRRAPAARNTTPVRNSAPRAQQQRPQSMRATQRPQREMRTQNRNVRTQTAQRSRNELQQSARGGSRSGVNRGARSNRSGR